MRDLHDYVNKRLRGFRVADAFLKEKGYKFGNFNVRVIKPHLLYGRKPLREKQTILDDKVFLVSDFYNKGEVKMVRDMRSSENYDKMKTAIDRLREELQPKKVYAIFEFNTFYHEKTNTILLFDL